MKTAHQRIRVGVDYLKKDRVLKPLIIKYDIWKPKKPGNLFEALVGEIINQQLSDKASETILNKFTLHFSGKFPSPSEVLRTKDKDLRLTGVSWAKVSYIKNVASYIEETGITVDSLAHMKSEKIRNELTKIKGIGSWTVDMLLIFTLNHLDILPLGDLGVKKAIQLLYNNNSLTVSEMEKIAKPWKPYRSVASWYLWRSLG